MLKQVLMLLVAEKAFDRRSLQMPDGLHYNHQQSHLEKILYAGHQPDKRHGHCLAAVPVTTYAALDRQQPGVHHVHQWFHRPAKG